MACKYVHDVIPNAPCFDLPKVSRDSLSSLSSLAYIYICMYTFKCYNIFMHTPIILCFMLSGVFIETQHSCGGPFG